MLANTKQRHRPLMLWRLTWQNRKLDTDGEEIEYAELTSEELLQDEAALKAEPAELGEGAVTIPEDELAETELSTPCHSGLIFSSHCAHVSWSNKLIHSFRKRSRRQQP